MSNDWQQVAGQLVANGAPVLGSVLGGPAGGVLGSLVGSLVGKALGVPADPAAISNAIATDPTAAQKIQAVEAEHKTLLEAMADDVESARQQTVDLAKSGSAVQWGAPVVSAITVTGFVGAALYAMIHGVSDSVATQMVLGALVTGFAQVIGYWLGSSFGSTQKDVTIAAFSKAKR